MAATLMNLPAELQLRIVEQVAGLDTVEQCRESLREPSVDDRHFALGSSRLYTAHRAARQHLQAFSEAGHRFEELAAPFTALGLHLDHPCDARHVLAVAARHGRCVRFLRTSIGVDLSPATFGSILQLCPNIQSLSIWDHATDWRAWAPLLAPLTALDLHLHPPYQQGHLCESTVHSLFARVASTLESLSLSVYPVGATRILSPSLAADEAQGLDGQAPWHLLQPLPFSPQLRRVSFLGHWPGGALHLLKGCPSICQVAHYGSPTFEEVKSFLMDHPGVHSDLRVLSIANRTRCKMPHAAPWQALHEVARQAGWAIASL